jgi:DNA-binding transcriptional LysR family regulator
MARKGLGLALVADWLISEDVRRGRLVRLLTEYATPPAPVYALSPPGRFPSTTVRALSDHLAEVIGAQLRTSSPVER